MKKPLSREVLAKEADHWNRVKEAVKENPGKACQK